MAVSGSNLALEFRCAFVRPVLDFSNCIFDDILPAFGKLDERAQKMASDYYNRVGSEPVGEYQDLDMADVADEAHGISLRWYETMVTVRQTMRNLLATGLFHLTEQQLAESCRDVDSDIEPPITKLGEIEKWYGKNFHLELKSLPSWTTLDELRRVANAVKHAEGSSTRQLKETRPELFTNPDYTEIYKEYEQEGVSPPMSEALAPLTGQDFFVSEKLLGTYAKAAAGIFEEIAGYFAAHGNQFFPY